MTRKHKLVSIHTGFPSTIEPTIQCFLSRIRRKLRQKVSVEVTKPQIVVAIRPCLNTVITSISADKIISLRFRFVSTSFLIACDNLQKTEITQRSIETVCRVTMLLTS